MIDRIHHRLLDGSIGEIPETLRLWPIGMLEDRLLEIIPLDEAQSIPRDLAERPLEFLLLKAISSLSLGEPDHIDLSDREESFRMLVEEEKPHILGQRSLARSSNDIHLTTEILHGQISRHLGQLTPHIAQELPYQTRREITDRSLLIHPVIEGDLSRQTDQLPLRLSLGLHRAGIAADVVMVFLGLSRHLLRHLIGTGQTAGSPEHEERPPLIALYTQVWEIGGLDQIAVSLKLLLDLIELILRNPSGWKDRLTMGITILTDHNIATTQILEVIGKGADRPQDRIGIPASFVLDAVPLHLPLS